MTFTLLIQLFVIVIIIGIFYSLWRTTQSYGGLVGWALKWIGLGIVFFSLEALDRVLGNLSFINSWGGTNATLLHNGVLLLGLICAGIGFSKLTKISK